MCLGIPGQVVELVSAGEQLARVDVAGVRRTVDISLLDGLAVGDWVLIHVGVAMSKIDEDQARFALEALQAMGSTTGGTGDP